MHARTHFSPDGNPAPPRPRSPDALISEMICNLSHYDDAIIGPAPAACAHPIVTLEDDLLRLVPVSVILGRLKISSV